MANPLFDMLNKPMNKQNDFQSQYKQLLNNPGSILEILLRSGKINHQQYNDLQLYRNNPQQIFNYLISNGKYSELMSAQMQAQSYK